MKRMLFALGLALSAVVSLAGCATDADDPFPAHASAHSDVPVAGAATPAPDSPGSGWKW